MVQVILFLEDNLIAKLLREPSNISRSCKSINVSRLENSWYIVHLDWNRRRVFLTILFPVLQTTIVVECPVAGPNGLSIVDPGAPALT